MLAKQSRPCHTAVHLVTLTSASQVAGCQSSLNRQHCQRPRYRPLTWHGQPSAETPTAYKTNSPSPAIIRLHQDDQVGLVEVLVHRGRHGQQGGEVAGVHQGGHQRQGKAVVTLDYLLTGQLIG